MPTPGTDSAQLPDLIIRIEIVHEAEQKLKTPASIGDRFGADKSR